MENKLTSDIQQLILCDIREIPILMFSRFFLLFSSPFFSSCLSFFNCILFSFSQCRRSVASFFNMSSFGSWPCLHCSFSNSSCVFEHTYFLHTRYFRFRACVSLCLFLCLCVCWCVSYPLFVYSLLLMMGCFVNSTLLGSF